MSIEYLLHLKHGCQGERFVVLSVPFKANPFLADEEKPAKLSYWNFWNWRKIDSTDDQIKFYHDDTASSEKKHREKHGLFVAAPVFDGDLLQVPVTEGRVAAVVVEDAHVAQLAEAGRRAH